jgi:hypothetical protein
MTGAELATVPRSERPSLAAIIASGFAEPSTKTDGVAAPREAARLPAARFLSIGVHPLLDRLLAA